MNKEEELMEEISEDAINDVSEETEPTMPSDDYDCEECSKDSDHDDELRKLKNIIIDMDGKVKYAQAELINYRKRKDEEVRDMLKYANEDLILEIIPTLDNLERALKLAKGDDEKLNQFLEGFKMIYSNLAETLRNFGVEEINALGEKFDHNLHLALLTDKDDTKEDEIILEVLLKGYTLKGRMIRPASVKINKLD